MSQYRVKNVSSASVQAVTINEYNFILEINRVFKEYGKLIKENNELKEINNFLLQYIGQLSKVENEKPKYLLVEGKNQRRKIRDITDMRFGLLTAKRPTDMRAGSAIVWECHCDCGGVTYRPHNNLSNKRKYQSCGCLNPSELNMKEFKDENFIDGTCVKKIRDMKLYASNTSGTRGVYHRPRSDRWSATIGFKGKRIHLGTYDTIHEAINARKNAEVVYFETFLNELDMRNGSSAG